MKVTINIECTPEEARAYMGLPDVTAINDHIVNEMKARVTALSPEELMKNWYAQAGEAQAQFLSLMTGGKS